MQTSIRAGIARIDVMQQGRSISRGTGFLVTGSLALTAMHVIADRTKESLTYLPGEILLTFPDYTTKAVIHEACFDRNADWALLKCETAPPVSVRPLPLAELRETGVAWETYGFPDANPQDGMVNIGVVSNHQGKMKEDPVFQLFSQEAAAGQGAPVKGLSGSPVIVGNAVVGILRYALMKDLQTVAGTVYACPIASVLEKTGSLLPMPDPCFGLPGLPGQPFPAEPFRYLSWFTADEAEIFFGRNREIRLAYDRLTSAEAPPITLLYGQSGVGKSSFLDAGLVPRLRWFHEVRYIRRDADSGLLQTLCSVLQDAGGTTGTLADWQAIEGRTGKPLIVFFDQIEEVFTHPNDPYPNELENLVGELKKLHESQKPPRGRLVLSFRKEWLPEVQKLMDEHALSCGKVFLEGLDEKAIIEVVNGLTQTERLKQRYGLKIEAGLAERIAGDLVVDRDSPIAPTLQILLMKLWQKATAISPSTPEETIQLYEALRSEGLLLGDFLDQQIEVLRGKHAPWVESGLVLDVLAFHTTSMLTFKERRSTELGDNYSNRKDDLPALVKEMLNLRLLSDTSGENEEKTTRLSHDTLAPLVRQRFEQSEKPGQQARRTLESRAGEWNAASGAGLLDQHSLRVVATGRAGMRALSSDEEKLITVSQTRERKRLANRRMILAGAIAAVLLIVASAGYAWRQSAIATQAKNVAELRYSTAEIAGWLSSADSANALVVAIRAVGWSRRVLGHVDKEVVKNLELAMEAVRERLVLHPAGYGAISSDGVIALADGSLEFWNSEGKQIEQLKDSEAQIQCGFPGCVSFSPDDKLVSIVVSGGILVWTRNAHRGQVLLRGNDDFIATSFSPRSERLLAVTSTGTIRVSTLSGQQSEYHLKSLPDHVRILHADAAFHSDSEGFVAAGGTDNKVYLWDLTGNLLKTFEGHRHDVTSVTLNALKELEVASGDSEGNLFLWNLQGQLKDSPINRHTGPITTLAFSPQGDVVISAGRDGVIYFTALDGRQAETPVHGFPSEITGLSLSPDGDKLLATSGSHSKLIDTYGIRLRPPFNARKAGDTETELSGVTLGSKGTVAVSDANGAVILWHPPTGYVRRIEPAETSLIVGMAFSADEGVFVTGSNDGKLRAWDRTGTTESGTWQTPSGSLIAFDLAPSGKFLVTVDGQSLQLWETDSHSKPDSITDAATMDLRSVKFMADGTRFITSNGQNVQVWTIRSGKIEKAESLRIPVPDGLSIFLGPNDQTFVAGAIDGEIGLWRANGSTVAAPFNPHDSRRPVLGAIAYPDGETTASFNLYNQNVTFCNFARTEEGANGSNEGCMPILVSGHRGGITAIALSPDGKTLASVGVDGTVRLLRAQWSTWLELSCDRLSKHPVFQDPAPQDPEHKTNLDLKLIQEARDTCRTAGHDHE